MQNQIPNSFLFAEPELWQFQLIFRNPRSIIKVKNRPKQ
jgi:hypothetical protein